MKASQVKISDVKDCSYEQLEGYIGAIEGDYQNVVGGIKAWLSGRETQLTKTAERKIEAIERLIEKRWPTDDA